MLRQTAIKVYNEFISGESPDYIQKQYNISLEDFYTALLVVPKLQGGD